MALTYNLLCCNTICAVEAALETAIANCEISCFVHFCLCLVYALKQKYVDIDNFRVIQKK